MDFFLVLVFGGYSIGILFGVNRFVFFGDFLRGLRVGVGSSRLFDRG